ncbi:M20 family metallopeptidase [Litorilinea aerophila]|uniref:M20 family metallopeptidase n=1 Tax=Litorilinea aerophila TaxID=1204385 RepID=UPI001B875E69|nr:M20 family metallopeptidase [Litorilinea aerophila]MCC9077548.1 M20 family metallopeptidase [Litorilinea aerophila]GIV79387.1 MAG: amidohydrolase [Litorilinea sp.]
MNAHKTEELKARVQEYLDEIADRLIQISQTLHANPEVAFEEYQSMALLADTAEAHGFQVKRGVAGLETAFVATSRGKPERPAIAFIAEYDALPGLGHACGHNIIGTAATGAALALQAIRDEIPGTIKLIGTPAEERGGGKVIMAERGVFDGLDAAMMVHPGTKAMTTRGTLASNKLRFEFFGKSAHAAAAPDKGINALDACIQTFNNINALRQHLTPDVRIHGIITHGGEAPNIVPEYAAAEFSVRAADSDTSFQVVEKVIRCAQAGALAAGAELKYTHLTHYANRIANPTLARLFEENISRLGEKVEEPSPNERMGSSDMGNVSQLVPAIHPYVVIADPGIAAHTPEFAQAAASERGNQALLRAAKAMAMTAVDLLTQPELVAQAHAEFRQSIDPNAAWRKLRFFS